jgi:hypothetical protein
VSSGERRNITSSTELALIASIESRTRELAIDKSQQFSDRAAITELSEQPTYSTLSPRLGDAQHGNVPPVELILVSVLFAYDNPYQLRCGRCASLTSEM